MDNRRTIAEIQAELDAFEAQFRALEIPPGTPDRRRLQREADAEAHARACLPANIQRRLALLGERTAAQKAARRAEKAKLRAWMIAHDPEYQAEQRLQQERQRIFRELRKMGFRREYTSGRSAYYRRGAFVVRISDHEVPLTDERQWNLDQGGRSWADSRWSFIVGGDLDADEWLDEVREQIADDDRTGPG